MTKSLLGCWVAEVMLGERHLSNQQHSNTSAPSPPRNPSAIMSPAHSPMSRATLFRTWKTGLIVLAVLLVGLALATRPLPELRTALVFAALVLLASFLRIDAGDASIGFEAAVVFGALVIFHHPAVALVSVLIGAGAHATYQAA
ncbi:MAG: hypothetical protein ACLGH0_06635, partial [Thermoanaerobaculia bacterium]